MLKRPANGYEIILKLKFWMFDPQVSSLKVRFRARSSFL